MKRGLLMIMVFVFLIPIALAEVKIHSGTVITGNDLKLSEGTFRFTFDSEGNQTFVQTPTINMIIKSGECRSNGLFRICMGSAEYYDRNATTWVTYYKVYTDIYKQSGSLSTSASAGSNTLLQKESTSVKITIQNPTEQEVTKISYAEDFYPFIVLNVTGCALEGTSFKWTGSLQSGYSQTCTATFYAPETPGTYNFAGNLSYFNGFSQETSSTSALSLVVSKKQLQVKESSDSNGEVDKAFHINLSLSNINPTENLDLSMAIPISANFNVLKKTAGMTYANGELAYSGRIQPGNSVNLSISLKPTAGGILSINKAFTYTVKNMRETIENSTYISVVDPNPIIDLNSEYGELSPGQRFIISTRIYNPSMVYTLQDIGAKLSLPFAPEINQNMKQLAPNQSYSIISNSFTLPESYSGDGLKVTFNLKYTLNGMEKSIQRTMDLKVRQPTSGGQSNGVLAADSLSNGEPVLQQSSGSSATQQPATPPQAEDTLPEPKEEKFSLKSAKLDFSNKTVLIFVGVLFLFLFIVPAAIYKIRKSKKETQSFVTPPIPPKTPK